MVKLKRWFKHLLIPPWRWKLAFPANVLQAIEQAITASEQRHRGELRFAVENSLLHGFGWSMPTALQRAVQVFANLRIWDTEENNGVLIYVLMADKEVHILADRGIAKKIDQAEWDRVALAMQNQFAGGHFQDGALGGIQQITDLLAKAFPPNGARRNELSNKPVIIRK